VNDSSGDARRLAALLHGIRCKINLIPLNPAPDLPDRPTPRACIEAFQQILHNAGLTATIRESRGWDISAACGMLRAESIAEAQDGTSAPSTAPAAIQ
jgi:23S rRNA (adenine2503-C2)-methyltransferase